MPDAAGPTQLLLSRVEGVRTKGRYWIARCPAHEDSVQSLSIRTAGDGKVLAKCHAGCSFSAIITAAGLTPSDMFPPKDSQVLPFRTGSSSGQTTDRVQVAQYDYTDIDGEILFQACRYEPKTFRQRRPVGGGDWVWNLDGIEPVIYRLPEVVEAIALGRRVYICEGEKDVDALVLDGLTATTSPMGAGKWRESMSQLFRDAPDVVILPDNDEPGRNHARLVANSLMAVNATVRIVALPNLAEHGDVSDWLDAGGDFDTLDGLVGATKPEKIDRAERKFWYLGEVLDNEELMAPPIAVVPRLAWRGRTTLLSAQVKGGKSTLVGYLAAQVSNGGYFLGAPCLRGSVMIVSLEEALGDTARRLKHFDAHPRYVRLAEHLKGDDKAKLLELRAEIERNKPVLVIVDTLMAYASGDVDSENDASQMQPIVQALTNLAHVTGTAILIVHHNAKGGGYRGSSAIAGAVDVVAEMTIPDEDRDSSRRKFHVVGRIPVHGFECRYVGDEYQMANAQGQPLIQRVLDFIRTNPRTTKRSVREAVGGSHDALDAAISTLVQRRFITDEGDGAIGCQYVASITAPASVDSMHGGRDG